MQFPDKPGVELLSAKESDYNYKNISIRHLQTREMEPTQVS